MSRIAPACITFCVISELLTGTVYEFEIVAKAVLGTLSVSGTRISSGPVMVISHPPTASTLKCGNSGESDIINNSHSLILI